MTTGTPIDEKTLVANAKKGDLQAFGQILSSLESRLFRVAFLLCGEREEARDLLQETFLNLHQSLSRFRGKSSLYTFAYRILLNLHHKRMRRRRGILLSLSEGVKIGPPGQSPGESFAKEEKKEKVRAAITRLPSPFQEIIILRYLEELSYQEIANSLGISEGTVKSRLFNAKQLLRKLLESER